MLYLIGIVVLVFWMPADLEVWFRPKQQMKFTTASWKRTDFGDANRYAMANSLVRTQELHGKTESEIRDLLGEPTSIDHVGSETWLGYDLVPRRAYPAKSVFLPSFLFYNTDTWLLEIRMDKGKVKVVRIRFT